MCTMDFVWGIFEIGSFFFQVKKGLEENNEFKEVLYFVLLFVW